MRTYGAPLAHRLRDRQRPHAGRLRGPDVAHPHQGRPRGRPRVAGDPAQPRLLRTSQAGPEGGVAVGDVRRKWMRLCAYPVTPIAEVICNVSLTVTQLPLHPSISLLISPSSRRSPMRTYEAPQLTDYGTVSDLTRDDCGDPDVAYPHQGRPRGRPRVAGDPAQPRLLRHLGRAGGGRGGPRRAPEVDAPLRLSSDVDR